LTGNAYGYTEVSVISTATSCIASADLGFCAFTAQMLDSELEPTQALWGGDEFWLEVSVNQITAPQDDWNLLDLELTWELPSLVEYDSERDPVFPAELDLTVTPSEDETHRYLQLDGTYLGPGIPPPTVQIQLPMTLNDPPEDLYYEENIEVGASASLHKDAKEIEGATAAMAGAILSAVAGGALARAKAKPTHTIEVVFWVVQEPAGGTPVTYKPVVTSTEIDEDILEAHDTFEAAKKKCNMKCDYSFSITKKTMSWAKYRQLLDKNKDGKLDDFATELGARENISEGSDHYEAGKMNVYYIPKLDVGLGELTPGKSGSKEKSAMFIEKGAQGGKSTFAHETLHYVDYKNDGDFDCDDNDAATGGNGPKNLMSHNRKPRTKYPDPRKKVFNITKKQGEHLCP